MSTHALTYTKRDLPASVASTGWIMLVVGLILGAAAFAIEPIRSQYVSIMLFTFMAGIGTCALFMVAIEYLAGAVWSTPIRRVFELVASSVLFLPLFAIPPVLGMWFSHLYEWTQMDGDPILLRKAAYLNQPFLLVRLVVILLVWILFYKLFTANSFKQDETRDQRLTSKNIKLSAIFIPVFGITLTILSIDFLMSLEPHWFSTMFGVNFFSGSLVASLGVVTIATVLLNEKGYLGEGISGHHYYSLGFGMFAGCIFWAYTAFSQGMLIWYANLPEETPWFMNRWDNGWDVITLALILIHFIIPLFGLIQRRNKFNPNRMVFMSVWVIFAHMFDLYWIVMPAYGHHAQAHSHGPTIGLAEFAAIAIAAGFLTVLFQQQAKGKNLVPVGDPKLQRGLNFRV